MDWSIVWKAALALSGLALLFGALLAIASMKFAVETDPRVDKVLEVLVGTNCGACGYPGCLPAAEAVVEGEAPVDVCLAGGSDVAGAVARVMGRELSMREMGVAHVHCMGGLRESPPRAIYQGIDSCAAADKIAGGGMTCEYGCLGLGTCKAVCPVNAIVITPDHKRLVNWDRCTGCGLCLEVCPRSLIELIPREQTVLVVCSNRDKGRRAKQVCTVSCIACKKCEKECPYEAITVVDNCARIEYEKCTQCGKCAEVCPTSSVRLVSHRKGELRTERKPKNDKVEDLVTPGT